MMIKKNKSFKNASEKSEWTNTILNFETCKISLVKKGIWLIYSIIFSETQTYESQMCWNDTVCNFLHLNIEWINLDL